MSEEFNFDEPESKSFGNPLANLVVWDYLSIVVLLVTVCLILFFTVIFINPNSSLNPAKPQALLIPTATPTPIQLEPTWTVTATVEFTPTATLRPTFTLPATMTPPNLTPSTETPTPTETPTATPTPKALFSASSVNEIESVLMPHLQSLGCDWQGVGGTVEDQNGSPIVGIVVYLEGRYDGKRVELTTVSGINPEYGKSGFEFVLGETPLQSRDEIFVQLLDQAGLPLSEQIYIDTFENCEKNLVLVRFKKNR